MSDLIYRGELLKKAIKEKRFVIQTEDLLRNELIIQTVYKDLAECIYSIPAVDAVEVVRCKDCTNSGKFKKYNGKEYVGCCRMKDEIYEVDPQHFCSYGERKGDAT